MTVLSISLGLALTSCVNPLGDQPKEDYDSYLQRTEGKRGGGDVAYNGTLAKTSAESFKGDYVAVCLAALSFQNLQRTLRFKATVDYVKTDDKTGSIDVVLQALKIGATNLSEPIGPTFSAKAAVDVRIAKLSFGMTPDLPKEANALTMVAFGIDGLAMQTAFTSPPKQFCANLKGKTRPSGIMIEGTGKDVCLFLRSESPEKDVVIPAAAEYSCPLEPTP